MVIIQGARALLAAQAAATSPLVCSLCWFGLRMQVDIEVEKLIEAAGDIQLEHSRAIIAQKNAEIRCGRQESLIILFLRLCLRFRFKASPAHSNSASMSPTPVRKMQPHILQPLVPATSYFLWMHAAGEQSKCC